MRATYAESTTKITDPFPVFSCRCGYITWAIKADKPVYCPKCGRRMIRKK